MDITQQIHQGVFFVNFMFFMVKMLDQFLCDS